jgi:hypothetical protein
MSAEGESQGSTVSVSLRMNRTLRDELQSMADKDMRSFNNLVNKFIRLGMLSVEEPKSSR